MREAVISFPMLGDLTMNPPSYFEIGSFRIYFYGVIIALGFLLAILYTSRTCKRLEMKMDDIYDYLIWAVIFSVVFARLYYVVFYYSWEQIRSDPMLIFRIRDGGLAIYGAVIGAIIGLAICARIKRTSLWRQLDVMSFGLLIGQTVGRWGNFINREAYGAETDIFCRMGLTTASGTIYVHPTFLYESLWNLAGLIVLHFHCKRRRRYQGQYFLLYLLWYGLGRAWVEGLRTDSLWLVPDVIRVSQLLAIVTALAALILYILNSRRLAAGKAPVFGALPGSHLPPETEAVDGGSESVQPEGDAQSEPPADIMEEETKNDKAE